MNISLKDKIAVVTGGARGIGAAIVRELAAQGATVLFTDISDEIVKAAETEFAADSITVRGYAFDVSSWDASQEAVKQMVTEYGNLHILVNNAGITRDGVILRMKDDDWHRVLKVNLDGVFNMCRHAAKPMLKAGGASIINMASVVGVHGNAGQANYAASKSGVIGLSKALAKELASRSVRVNVIAPGYIQTDMTRDLPDSVKEQMLAQIPLNRVGLPADIANLTGYLASDASSYITGQVFQVDGGMYI